MNTSLISMPVTLRIDCRKGSHSYSNLIKLGGRAIAHATGKNSDAYLYEGVTVLAGKFEAVHSIKTWTTWVTPGTVILVRDFPKYDADELIAKYPVNGDSQTVYSIEPDVRPVDFVELKAERARIAARLQDIDAVFAQA